MIRSCRTCNENFNSKNYTSQSEFMGCFYFSARNGFGVVFEVINISSGHVYVAKKMNKKHDGQKATIETPLHKLDPEYWAITDQYQRIDRVSTT